jgi:hypothetical protein
VLAYYTHPGKLVKRFTDQFGFFKVEVAFFTPQRRQEGEEYLIKKALRLSMLCG